MLAVGFSPRKHDADAPHHVVVVQGIGASILRLRRHYVTRSSSNYRPWAEAHG